MKGLQDLESHRVEDEKRVEYNNGTATLVINKENGWIGFINRELLRKLYSKEEPISEFKKAQSFIQQYGGGFGEEVIAEWLGVWGIYFSGSRLTESK